MPLIARAPNLIAIRTLSKAFGLAALRVGYAIASPEVAARARPPPRPRARLRSVGADRRRRAARSAARRRADRRRARADARCARRRRLRLPPSQANFVLVRTDPAPSTGSTPRASSSAASRTPSGSRFAFRPRTTGSWPRSAPSPRRRPLAPRSSSARRPRPRSGCRSTSTAADAPGSPPGSASSTTCSTLLTFHGGLDLEVLAGGDLEVDEHHTVEDVLAALGDALRDALDGRVGRCKRYGSATVPMDEARATAAVDLVRRPHAEIALAFRGDRVGGLAMTLLPHALERFAIQAGYPPRGGHRRGRPPRRRGGVQGARPCAARGVLRRRRRDRLDEGLAVREKPSTEATARLSASLGGDVVTPQASGSRWPTTAQGTSAASASALRAGGRGAGGHRPIPPRCAGTARRDRRRRQRRSAAAAGSSARARRRRSAPGRRRADPLLGICVGMQLLFGRARRAAAGLASCAGRVERLRARRVPHMGWNSSGVTAPTAFSTSSTAGTSTSRTRTPVCRRRRSPWPRSTTAPRWSRRSSTARSPVSSSTPSAAARPARSAPQRARMVKKRVIPCLDVAAGASSRASGSGPCARSATPSSWRRATPSSARTSSSSSTSRRLSRAAGRCSAGRAGGCRPGDPLHRRRRNHRARGCAVAAPRGRGQGLAEPRRRRRALLAHRARRPSSARRRSSARSTPAQERSSPTPATTPVGSAQSPGLRRRSTAAPARSC